MPSYAEEYLIDTIKSLFECDISKIHLELIIIINDRVDSDEKIKAQNRQSIVELNAFLDSYSKKHFEVFYSYQKDLSKKHGGVGLARKIGMDEALRRALHVNKINLPIVCLDADCKVSLNYIQSIKNYFTKNRDAPGASIYFEHPNDNESIVYYELFLRYYVNALRYANFPYAFHTVGSSMAVRALEYAMEGGMNRRKAGEDFYFIHKIIPRGQFGEINDCLVYPSSRKSERVPFGTGRAMIEYEKDNSKMLNIYSFKTFKDLKLVLQQIHQWYQNRESESKLIKLYNQLPELFKNYIELKVFLLKISESNENSSTEKSFIKRIYQWLDAFTILKLVHFGRDTIYPNEVAIKVANELLIDLELKASVNSNVFELLDEYRKMDREEMLSDKIRNI